jgi:hypothetical protein
MSDHWICYEGLTYLHQAMLRLCLFGMTNNHSLPPSSLLVHQTLCVLCSVQTLNNLACCYRRMKKPRTALNLLRESLAIISAENGLDGELL